MINSGRIRVLTDQEPLKLKKLQDLKNPGAKSLLGFEALDKSKMSMRLKKDGTDKVNKIRERETLRRRKILDARLKPDSEGPKLLNYLDMTQRGIEFLIDCFDNLENEGLIDKNFLIQDAQKEFLAMQEAFFPKEGFSDEKDLERMDYQNKIDFILSELSRMDKSKLNRIYNLIKKGFKHD